MSFKSTKVQQLTVSTVLALFNVRSAYILGYAWLLGMSIWVTFIGGFIALKALPRQMFGTLQHSTFPVYFKLSITLAGGLLGAWIYGHPKALDNLAEPTRADVAQVYTLATVVLAQCANQFVVGPLTSKTMFKRHKLEKDEKKNYNDPGVSAEMRSLNRTFGMLHGISSLFNLSAVIAIIFHGLWVANNGVGL